jgi:adenosylmethionine-8-amino-7-oxononanoate aminotransferase
MHADSDLERADHRHLWHPFTQQQDWEQKNPLVIDKAEGTNLIDLDGNLYIDGVSSLWCNVHGHRHPVIDAAVRSQLDRVAHSTMLGLSHRPGIELAKRLAELAPGGLERVFYSDSGSTAAEIAIKMALQYWQQLGEDSASKTRFVSLADAYHGDTIGSVSVGGIELFHARYGPLLFDSIEVEPGDVEAMESVLKRQADQIAAVIMEPLVQGAAGMLLHPDGYLRAVRELCDRYNVLLICDEVAVGFGRTGTMFACEQEGVAPDFLCLAKGISGGYLPLAATLTTERIYQGFTGSYTDYRAFFHGHTYTGNPLACAAALATLDVFESERTLERLQAKISLLSQSLEQVAALEAVGEVRQRGFMCGIELSGYPASACMGQRVTEHARRLGAIVRPLGDVVICMPPLAISEPDLSRLCSIVAEAITEAVSDYSAGRAYSS